MNPKNSNQPIIRKAETTDIDIIDKILDMEPFKYDDEIPYERSWIEQLVTNERCLTLVYENDGLIKGFISRENGEWRYNDLVLRRKKRISEQYSRNKAIYEFERICKETGVNAILAYGYKTSAGMLDRLNYYSNDNTYREFHKPLTEQ